MTPGNALDSRSVFIDTNVLVYATVVESPWHESARRALRQCNLEGCSCWISRQVLREFVAVLTRPQVFSPPLKIGFVLDRMVQWERHFRVAEDGPNVTRRLEEVLRRTSIGGKRIHDANIVATMLAHGITRLLTYNTADFECFADELTLLSTDSWSERQ